MCLLLAVATVRAAVVPDAQHLPFSSTTLSAAKDAAVQTCRLSGGMRVQTTYAMIKPDVASDEAIVNDIKQRIEAAGLDIVREERSQLSLAQCEEFYGEHRCDLLRSCLCSCGLDCSNLAYLLRVSASGDASSSATCASS